MRLFPRLFGKGNEETRKEVPLVSRLGGFKSSTISSLAFSADERLLAVASGGVQVWDVETSSRVATPLLDSQALSLAFGPRGDSLMVGLASGAVETWRTDSWQRESAMQVSGFPVDCLAINGQGTSFAVSSRTQVQLWDCAARMVVRQLDGHGPGRYQKFYPLQGLRTILFELSGDVLTSLGWDGNILRWSVSTGELIAGISVTPAHPFESVCDTVSGLVTVGKSLVLASPMSNSLMTSVYANRKVRKVAGSGDGRVIAVSIDYGSNSLASALEFWDASVCTPIATLSVPTDKLGPILLSISGGGKYVAYNDIDSVSIFGLLP